ncbi:cold-shock protein [Pseudofrankia inefficax]|uniref:cold-shock protein n=1 Tax=Pseudofrankia inefficax (strain DSM 45817 / CECT 9037 / DDB 130130 / EuI1c) TaxID=298654 RepID=UPI00059DFBBB|nr:cold shock domain-containing protein [Pseudofrankia inefficax]
MRTGRVLRFDQVRGYGFIAPTGGGEDIFLHANDLLVDKHLVTAGVTMEFEVEQGDRGPKATGARLVRSAPGAATPGAPVEGAAAREPGDEGEDFFYVPSAKEFSREVTEILLQTEPTLTGAQILAIRRGMTRLAEKNGWIEG